MPSVSPTCPICSGHKGPKSKMCRRCNNRLLPRKRIVPKPYQDWIADPKTKTRFLSKIDVNTSERGCWLWTASRKGTNTRWAGRYGQFKVGNRMSLSHRVSFELFVGPIPAGLDVLHKCDVTLCVNPDHLFLGTQLDNMRDAASKGRCRHQRLTADDVRAIRVIYATGTVTLTDLATEYGCTFGNISSIVRRKNWKHVG